jgi:acyl-CoA thioesterase FadM
VAASCEYKQPLRFEDEIDVAVRAAFGRRSIDYTFAIARGGNAIAAGRMTSVCARPDAAGVLRTVEIPSGIAARLRSVLR